MTEPTPEAPLPTVAEGRLDAQEELTEERDLRRRKAREAIRQSEANERERQRQRGIDNRSRPRAALVEYRVGNRTYPYKTVPSCKVCHSPWRVQIESQIASGRTVGQVARDLPEQAQLGYANIYNHKQRHLPPGLATTVALIEQRAEEKGLSIQNGTDLLTDEVTLARLTVQRTTERLVAGEIEPSLAEGLTAGRWLNTLGEEGNAAMDDAAYAQSVVRYFQIAREEMSLEQWSNFLVRIREDPILAALSGRTDEEPLEAEPIDEGIADAEVVG
jgi:hypothetical protein